MVDPANEIVIEPTGRRGGVLNDLWQYRELMGFLIWRDLISRYKQTVIGIAWAVVRPLVTVVTFTVVFGRLAALPSGGIPYSLVVAAGTLPWQFFSSAVAASASSLVGSSNLITKVFFPRLVVPVAAVFFNFVDLAICLLLVIVYATVVGVSPGWQLLALPLFLGLCAILAIGIGILMATLNVVYRDIQHVLPFLLQVGLFVSPVGFETAVVPATWRNLFVLNPLVGIINGCRWSVSGGIIPLDPLAIGAAVVVTGGALVIGLHVFERTESRFADII